MSKQFGNFLKSIKLISERDRITKKSKYIPQTKRSQIEKLEAEKAPVRKILEVLG
ncbi:MAG: hypothetical protein ACRC8K_15465 [Waterburya sp.]